ncbi:MAG: hypothetical protein P1S60_12730 [Anaerolineae bacterium]|nr:hypothetical protein [Anaerolineae bacterium]
MFLLTLAILCSFCVSLLIKWNEAQGLETRIVLASNYITTIVLGWLFVISNGAYRISLLTLFLGMGGGLL